MNIEIGDKVEILTKGKYNGLIGRVSNIVDDEYHVDTKLYSEPKLVITKKVRRCK